MRQKLCLHIFVVAALAMTLAFSTSALAKNDKAKGKAVGPALKATGGVAVMIDTDAWAVSFDAQEGKGGKPAKGQLQLSNDTTAEELAFDVQYVSISGKYAWFAAVCVADSSLTDSMVGQWLFVKAYDNGTPGRKGDFIGWDWNSIDEADAANRVATHADPAIWLRVTSGNLVVHKAK